MSFYPYMPRPMRDALSGKPAAAPAPVPAITTGDVVTVRGGQLRLRVAYLRGDLAGLTWSAEDGPHDVELPVRKLVKAEGHNG